MPYQNHRKAFSMLTAIVVIILMATVAMLTMSISGKIVKETTAQYQREQAILLANSYTEYAVMAVTANDRTVQCLSTIRGTYNGYRARIQISYIGTAAIIGTCTGTKQLATVTAGNKSPLTIIVDAYIDYDDLDNPSGAGVPKMTYHRRTVQKI